MLPISVLVLLLASLGTSEAQMVLAEGHIVAAKLTVPSDVTAVHGDACTTPGQLATGASLVLLCHAAVPTPLWRALGTAPGCGDGVVDDGETCDAGSENGQVCTVSCTLNEAACVDFNPDDSPSGNNHVQLPVAPFRDLASSTLETWIYAAAVPALALGVVETEQTRLRFFPDGTLRVEARPRAATTSFFLLFCPAPFPLNGWHHVAATVSGASATDSGTTVSLYIDGEQVPNCALSEENSGGEDQHRSDLLGTLSPETDAETGIDSASRGFDGKLGHYLRGWDHVRSASDLAAGRYVHYASPVSGLVMQYRFDTQSSPDSVLDLAQPGNAAATLEGATAWCLP